MERFLFGWRVIGVPWGYYVVTVGAATYRVATSLLVVRIYCYSDIVFVLESVAEGLC